MATEEQAFHKAIDKDPKEQTARLVFADYLQEQGSDRAEGYRILAKLNRVPCLGEGVLHGGGPWLHTSFCHPAVWQNITQADNSRILEDMFQGWLPVDWFTHARRLLANEQERMKDLKKDLWCIAHERWVLEDHVAMAWNFLEESRKEKIRRLADNDVLTSYIGLADVETPWTDDPAVNPNDPVAFQARAAYEQRIHAALKKLNAYAVRRIQHIRAQQSEGDGR